MRILSNRLALLAVATLALVGVARAEDAKEVTLTGTMQCAKCSLHEEGVTTCQDVLTVKDGDKETKYYIAAGDAQKAAHVCKGTKDGVTVTGTVETKDGKQVLTASKVEGGGSGGHDHSKKE